MGSLDGSHASKTFITLPSRSGVSSDGSTEEGTTFKLTHVVADRAQFLMAVGRRTSIYYWLLVRGHPQFLATWASPT